MHWYAPSRFWMCLNIDPLSIQGNTTGFGVTWMIYLCLTNITILYVRWDVNKVVRVVNTMSSEIRMAATEIRLCYSFFGEGLLLWKVLLFEKRGAFLHKMKNLCYLRGCAYLDPVYPLLEHALDSWGLLPRWPCTTFRTFPGLFAQPVLLWPFHGNRVFSRDSFLMGCGLSLDMRAGISPDCTWCPLRGGIQPAWEIREVD